MVFRRGLEDFGEHKECSMLRELDNVENTTIV